MLFGVVGRAIKKATSNAHKITFDGKYIEGTLGK